MSGTDEWWWQASRWKQGEEGNYRLYSYMLSNTHNNFFQAPLQIFLVIFFSYRDVVVIPSSLNKLKLNSVGEMAVAENSEADMQT